MLRERFALFDVLCLAYLGAVVLILFLARQRVEGWEGWIGLHLALAVLVLVVALSLPRRPSGWRLLLRFWYPLVLILVAYGALEGLVPAVHARSFDGELAAIDRAIFGVQPAVWLEPHSKPWLTEILQLAYLSFYFMPIAVGSVLLRKRRLAEFEHAAAAIVGGFFSSFLLYFAVPALGPRFHLAPLLDPLPSWLSSIAIRAGLNWLEGIQHDAFPSGHAEVAIICLGLALRLERRLAVWLAPLVVLMLVSAVYLRYHYVVDLAAGAALAGIILCAVPPARRSGAPGAVGRGPGPGPG